MARSLESYSTLVERDERREGICGYDILERELDVELALCMCVMHGVRRLTTVIGAVGVFSMVSRDLNTLSVGDRALKFNPNI